MLAKIAGMKIVITAHDVTPLSGRSSMKVLARIGYHMADAIIAHNKRIEHDLANYAALDKKKVTIIPSGNHIGLVGGVPPKYEARKRLGIKEEEISLLFFGQIKKTKGLDTLLKALPHVVGTYPKLKLMVAGRVWKDNIDYYTDIAKQVGVADYCTWRIEYIPNEEATGYFSAADIIVLPYRQIYQSAVVLMALSLGKVVLASDLEGMREVIIDGETGFLFPADDSKALGEKLSAILSNPSKMSEVAESGYQKALCDHSWSMIGRLTAQCYEKALGRLVD